jgi:hypothetical protein
MIFGRPGDPSARGSTRFGGQPDWIDTPAWPVGRTLGGPMRFLAQVALPRPLRVSGHRMAYLFLADHDPARFNLPYEYDAGDNAVILQGGGGFVPDVEVRPMRQGPTLRLGRKPKHGLRIDDDPASPETHVPVSLAAATEPDPLPEQELHWLYKEDPKAFEAYAKQLKPSKVGGSPLWLQGPDTPLGGPWKLLAQVDIEHVPCWAPFDGWLYTFVAEDGTSGRMLYQIT